MDGVQQSQGNRATEETVYLPPLSSQEYLVLISKTSEG